MVYLRKFQGKLWKGRFPKPLSAVRLDGASSEPNVFYYRSIFLYDMNLQADLFHLPVTIVDYLSWD